tara:strand:- start:15489 stop:15659 length:171 start_codon:yes stop_codon:yes gene_type:complete
MQDEIIELYKNKGYTPEQVIKDLTGLLGVAILSLKETKAYYTSERLDVDVTVTVHK